MKKVLTVATVLVLAACSGGGYSGPTPGSGPAPSANAPIGWPVRTAEFVDLWLHGYAMVTDDTAKVPLYDRGYRERIMERRRQANVTTMLDANRQSLMEGRLKSQQNIDNGQFAVFNFSSWEELSRVAKLFVENEGSPLTVNDQTTQQLFVVLRNSFRTVAEREWLRLFVQSLDDEQTKFYNSYWNAQQIDRGPARSALETAWNNTYKSKFQRFLRNERLTDGTFILSIPIGGEGRAVLGQQQGSAIAAAFPTTAADAMNALYVFTHEITGSAAQRAIEDNLTPAQAREGAAAKLIPIGAVRAGAILLQRIAPELVEGYQRFYLRQTGATVPSGNPADAFASAFTLSQPILDGITRQIDLVLAGI
jgi:hypothetical protein